MEQPFHILPITIRNNREAGGEPANLAEPIFRHPADEPYAGFEVIPTFP
jgi:hypothetical protein